MSGHLRQEFRELHLLNHITEEIYEGRLEKIFFAQLRNPMLYKFQTEIKRSDLNKLHSALKLSQGELLIEKEGEDGTWNLDTYKRLMNPDGAEKRVIKRKLPESHVVDQVTDFQKKSKKIKLDPPLSQNFEMPSPLGLTWDENDYSCAYDSLFTVLHHIWIEGQLKHRAYFENGTQKNQILHSRFMSLLNKTCTFESVRDQLRVILNHEKPGQYRYGKHYTDIDELVRDFASTKPHAISRLRCLSCSFSIDRPFTYLQDYTAVGWSSKDRDDLQQIASIQRYLDYKINKQSERTGKFCPNCRKNKKEVSLYNSQYINELLSVLIFALAPWIDINKCLRFDASSSSKEYILKGIIYSNDHHFTAKLIDGDLNVWYHDGQTTRSLCRKEQSLKYIDDALPQAFKKFDQYTAIMAFYAVK